MRINDIIKCETIIINHFNSLIFRFILYHFNVSVPVKSI